MRKILLINVVGLTPSAIGKNTPNISALAGDGVVAPLGGVFPAVTCTAQSSMVTGGLPREHGVVGNGWFFRDLSEVCFWKQSNHLVRGEKVWESARKLDPAFTTANLFWWYNMYSTVDYSLTPRPLYFADGRKLPGSYGAPPAWREKIERALPPFPLFNFWGPTADIRSSEWIADSALLTMKDVDPTLTMVYIPHLDYDLQRLGPDHPEMPAQLRAVDACVGRMIDHARETGREIMIVSEYGITGVTAPVHINRALRSHGWLKTTPQLDTELLDPGASDAFAVADHQVAHVYIRDPELIPNVKTALEAIDGIDTVMDRNEQGDWGIDHTRSGELVAVASPDRWFTYYFWEDDARAPDYARTVDIHRKPGYDPVELFLDPKKPLLKARILGKLLRKKAGFRTLMNVIPLDASLVRGSHGRLPGDPDSGPIIISSRPLRDENPTMTRLPGMILDLAFGD